MDREKSLKLIKTAAAGIAAIIVAIVTIALISKTPGDTLQIFFLGPFKSLRYFGNVVEAAIPLMFAGLAMAVVFQASLVNLAAEGIFFIGGMLASAFGVCVILPSGIHPLVIILAGGLIGMGIMMIPGILKAKFNTNELLVSLMLNSIASGAGIYLISNVFKDPSTAVMAMVPFPESAKLPVIIPGTRIHLGLVIVMILAVLLHYFLYRSKWGYEIRMVGINREFAKYSGINIARVIIIAHLVSGCVAGMGAAVENIGLHDRFEWSALPGYGFTGALIAIMGENNPKGILLASMFIAYLSTGANLTSRLADIPAELGVVLQGIIFLIISIQKFLPSLKTKWLMRGQNKVAEGVIK